MGYKILHDGTFVKCDGGAEHLYGAVLQRLEDLLKLISDEAELEVDYDSVGNKWIAMEYFPEKECAIELADTVGNSIVAFSGVPHDIMVDTLNKSDVWFVG